MEFFSFALNDYNSRITVSSIVLTDFESVFKLFSSWIDDGIRGVRLH
jgi:hypothetical protein